jgi:hypothetical protein
MKVASLTAGLALLGTLAGGIYYVDERYAQRQWAEERIAGLQDQYNSSRLNQVDQQIIDLEREGERRRLSPMEENLLRRLKRERQKLLCELRIEQC